MGRKPEATAEVVVERVGTAEDVQRIDQLTAEDFGDPVQNVQIVVGPDGRVSEADLNAAASQLSSTFTLYGAEHTKQGSRMNHD